jgi:peptidoglycan/LPS O-acetylase OafA/YrhL
VRLGHQPALDGLRGIAIALVVSFHAFGWPADGTLGVDLFFVLSGFLITTLLLDEHRATGRIGLSAFYLRRARRLLPALLVLLLAFLLITLASAGLWSPIGIGLVSALTYTSNIVVAADPSAVPAGMLHLWSLAAEEQFYIVWPVALILGLRFGGRRLALGGLLLLLVAAVGCRLYLTLDGASIHRLYYGPDTHADPLIVGCIFGCCFHWRLVPRRLLTSASIRLTLGGTALAALVATAALVHLLPARIAYETQLLPTGSAVLAGVVIVSAAAGRSPVARGLATPPLASLGRISYSLYLWHLPILVAFAGVERSAGVRTVAAVAVSVAVAAVSRRFIELPFLARRRRDSVVGAPKPAVA